MECLAKLNHMIKISVHEKLYEKVYYQDFTNNESILNHDHLLYKYKTPYKR
nr:hypothetical protein [Mycoplasmopsis agalactiae]